MVKDSAAIELKDKTTTAGEPLVAEKAEVKDTTPSIPQSSTFFEKSAYDFQQKRMKREVEQLNGAGEAKLQKGFLDKIGLGWLGGSGKTTPIKQESPFKLKQ